MTGMRALVLEDYKKLVVKDVEKPVVEGHEVLIRVKAVSICGSDVHGYDGTTGRRVPPVIMGHEASGVVEETGVAVKRFKEGDRVVFNSTLFCGECPSCAHGMQNMCDSAKVYGVATDAFNLAGAMAEYIKVPEHILFRLPDGIPFDQASLIEPMSIALHAINHVRLNINDAAVVFGAGTIGLMVLKILRISSVGKIIHIDIDDKKLECATKNGADLVVNSEKVDLRQAVLDATGGKGADVVFEAVGVPATIAGAVSVLRRAGTAVLLGNLAKSVEMPMQSVVVNELKLFGSYCCSMEYEESIKLLDSGKIRVNDLISARGTLDEGADYFEKLYTQSEALQKVVLFPG
jgi:threonine dehydrogenase-like Zn-dependent dehydrogenase